jgi:thiamine biosynthesis lipoprotein ApbE
MSEKFDALPEEKRQKILTACLDEFAEHGYVNASTNRIVRAAGISKGLLFHYFESKKKLFLYVLDHTIHYLMEKMNRYSAALTGDLFETLGQYALIKMQIGIEEPDAMPRRARHVVPLSGRSMATSGDYRIFFEQDGRRYSHEIDPTTAAPIAHRLCSVTVVDDNCTRADALATALIVLGQERGFALAERSGVAAQFIERVGPGRYTDRMTSAFAALGARPLA